MHPTSPCQDMRTGRERRGRWEWGWVCVWRVMAYRIHTTTRVSCTTSGLCSYWSAGAVQVNTRQPPLTPSPPPLPHPPTYHSSSHSGTTFDSSPPTPSSSQLGEPWLQRWLPQPLVPCSVNGRSGAVMVHMGLLFPHHCLVTGLAPFSAIAHL